MKKLLVLTALVMLTASAAGCRCLDWCFRGARYNPCPPATYSNPCPPYNPCDPCATPSAVTPGPAPYTSPSGP